MSDIKAIFISDLHLGAKYIADARAHEARVVGFLQSVASDATHLFLLGDILDYWFEYRNVVPRGFVRFFGELARLADSGVKITWMTGNHDIWLFDYLRDEIGIDIIDAPYVVKTLNGKRMLLAHGDRIGQQKLGFRLICSVFRNPVCQKLYASLHPRLTIPFALGWSKSSRGDEYEKDGPEAGHIERILRDAEAIVARDRNLFAIVEGHHHLALDTKIKDSDTQLVVLGDWINKFTYGTFDGHTLKLEKFITN